MLNRFLLLFFIITGLTTNAQKTADPEIFAKTITAEDLKKHLSVIAGPEMEGRDTPSPGLEKAADYISEQFKKAGVKPGNNGSFRQTFYLSKDSVPEMSLRINGQSFVPYTDFAPYGINNDSELNFSEYVFAGYGVVDEMRDDYKNVDVKNKLVVVFEGLPKNHPAPQGLESPAFIFNKIRTATGKGAAAVIVITEQLPRRTNMVPSYRPVPSEALHILKIPVFRINENVIRHVSGENISTVREALDKGAAPLGAQKANISLKYKSNQILASASNILGIVEGSDKKDEYVIITAHYDHVGKDANGNIFYGADDDGSGTVAVIEMAEAFAKAKKAGMGPRRTVVFMTVSAEEKGLWGSEYYAANPIFPLEKTSANLNMDMIGRIGTDYLNEKDAENYIYVIGDDKLSSDLTPITDKVNNRYVQLKLDRRFNDLNDRNRFYYRSDHYNFAKKGVPAIFYFNGVHADYHQITDTIDKINFPLMAKRAQLVFHTAWEIANRDEMLKRDRKLPAGGR